jgi:hypothetical protein
MSEYRVQRNNPNTPKGKDAQDDDILEYALSLGVRGASKRLSVSEDKIREVVLAFKKDIDDEGLCFCQINKNTMCFFCLGPDKKERINLPIK